MTNRYEFKYIHTYIYMYMYMYKYIYKYIHIYLPRIIQPLVTSKRKGILDSRDPLTNWADIAPKRPDPARKPMAEVLAEVGNISTPTFYIDRNKMHDDDDDVYLNKFTTRQWVTKSICVRVTHTYRHLKVYI
jgi:hypothetical protein